MDQNERLHRDWIGMAQPEGLVVTASALKEAEANVTWPVTELQETLADLAGEAKTVVRVRDLLREVLGWSDELVVEGAEVPASLRVALDGGEELRPTLALRSADEADRFALVVMQTEPLDADLDAASDDKRWTASPHQRFERLLRETGVHAGLLVGSVRAGRTRTQSFRLVYAPRGESAGWIDFRHADLLTVDGRSLLGAFHMLLNERRLLSLEEPKRLGALLKASREYQNTVSTKLREQVLGALRELTAGFQHADRIADGRILGAYRGEHLQEVYKGLVTVLMRMVFVLYAEERGLLPLDSDLYAEGYSLTRLYAQLQADRARHGDTINDRYGAWARIVTLFRLLHDGVRANGLSIPRRRGALFDPDAHPFLEGRARGAVRQLGEALDVPRVSDGVVHRVLDQLLVLGGERLQYKGLDVEQIGSVYEGLMGFELEVAEGDSLAVLPEHVVVDLEAVLRLGGAERVKRFKEEANLDLKDKMGGEVKAATTVAELHAALGRRASPRSPGLIPKGALYLQPGEERRKTGPHYTPRSLTQPIVETTLRPLLERLGAEATPEAILELKICDPAMGSGAFLVEVCRQLADRLVDAWKRTRTLPELPQDEDLVLHARRLIAQRCLYGVDKNPLAVDLARLSLWLVTFARQHPFTFVDHALRCGDSLVGLSREQIASFTLDLAKGGQVTTVRPVVERAVARAEELRRQIHAIGDPPDTDRLEALWREASDALETARMLGDLVVASFFGESSEKGRRKRLEEIALKTQGWLATGEHEGELRGIVAELREGARGVVPFHWEIEPPEVFCRTGEAGANGGFDAFVGNPPFVGGTMVGGRLGLAYHAYIIEVTPGSTALVDLVGFFLRRSFALIRNHGTFGLLATNTIAQGDTRDASLTAIIHKGGTIYEARRRFPWPGEAAVIVSVIHAVKGSARTEVRLDGLPLRRISAFLLPGETDTTPKKLPQNRGRGYVGAKIWGAGFLFEPKPSGGSSPLEDMERVLRTEPGAQDVIFSFMGGEEFNASPTQAPNRFVIDFGEMTETQARAYSGPFSIVEERVRPVRLVNEQRNRRENWWLHVTRVPEATEHLRRHQRLLALAQVSKHFAVAFVRGGTVLANTMMLILMHEDSAFSIVQSRVHEAWARLTGSSMKDDLRYTTDCFDTFPFCLHEGNGDLSAIGREYYDFRAALMVKNNEGLTKTYNRFHDRDERSPEILELRRLHAAMDRAVLDAYGWKDIQPVYDFREQLDESIRYTWAEETRDEVLARLLELNRVYAEKEAAEAAQNEPPKKGRRAKAAAEPGAAPKARRPSQKRKEPEGAVALFSDDPKSSR